MTLNGCCVRICTDKSRLYLASNARVNIEATLNTGKLCYNWPGAHDDNTTEGMGAHAELAEHA